MIGFPKINIVLVQGLAAFKCGIARHYPSETIVRGALIMFGF